MCLTNAFCDSECVHKYDALDRAIILALITSNNSKGECTRDLVVIIKSNHPDYISLAPWSKPEWWTHDHNSTRYKTSGYRLVIRLIYRRIQSLMSEDLISRYQKSSSYLPRWSLTKKGRDKARGYLYKKAA